MNEYRTGWGCPKPGQIAVKPDAELQRNEGKDYKIIIRKKKDTTLWCEVSFPSKLRDLFCNNGEEQCAGCAQ